MPLDDKEQRILEEIERQFYAEDPELAETVRSARLASRSSGRVRLAGFGLVAGLALMIGFFTRSTWVALVGFGIMVASAAALSSAVKHRASVAAASPDSMAGRMRRRWRGR
ncbi:MAG TPA: DUF3040 domain-containing protein [Acidimicrobiia bacterium]|nr:DUF3040 domain-containing protein [Acidimicrobiia bacterium]